jgi:hypothetical protein
VLLPVVFGRFYPFQNIVLVVILVMRLLNMNEKFENLLGGLILENTDPLLSVQALIRINWHHQVI